MKATQPVFRSRTCRHYHGWPTNNYQPANNDNQASITQSSLPIIILAVNQAKNQPSRQRFAPRARARLARSPGAASERALACRGERAPACRGWPPAGKAHSGTGRGGRLVGGELESEGEVGALEDALRGAALDALQWVGAPVVGLPPLPAPRVLAELVRVRDACDAPPSLKRS